MAYRLEIGADKPDEIRKRTQQLKQENINFEKAKQKKLQEQESKEKEYTIDDREDKIAESIMEKLATNVIEDRIIKKVLYLIRIDKANDAAGLLSQEIILTDKEKEHFSRLRKEIVLSWFRSYIDKVNKQEELEEE